MRYSIEIIPINFWLDLAELSNQLVKSSLNRVFKITFKCEMKDYRVLTREKN